MGLLKQYKQNRSKILRLPLVLSLYGFSLTADAIPCNMILHFLTPFIPLILLYPLRLPLPLLVLWIQRADDVHIALPFLAAFPSYSLCKESSASITLASRTNIKHNPDASSILHYSYYIFQPSRPIEKYQHTLQPSQSFFTELLTFIPRNCSCTPFTTSIRPATDATTLDFVPIIGLCTVVALNVVLLKHRDDIEARHV
jgi:hypothetical protein